MLPQIIEGNKYSDGRGKLFFNNDFDATEVKRIYFIENVNTEFVRGWQGHKIEQRWFTAVVGSFKIWVQALANYENEIEPKELFEFELNSQKLNVLHIPGGYITAIQSLEPSSKLLVMADYFLGEINDEFRFEYK
jgi:dTDP-4-dehydrorhamnose 3,5-epimerase-like enzyme